MGAAGVFVHALANSWHRRARFAPSGGSASLADPGVRAALPGPG
ncbi:hypothetical protein LF41_2659 [Lysobacter dokdonensis DS-58]|uniref:Uncharacterized protein n=1 Tax=Lysobacter dokdonensis DS-58 TaxID=1300345 RepID=A0A0A2WHS3_9GAMM|nr:hypothetical protein LF41_2659 [Lysobacter dokdonensis DS-58]